MSLISEFDKENKNKCYCNGHFITYTAAYNLRYDVTDNKTFNESLIKILKQIRLGGFCNMEYINDITQRETKMLILLNIEILGGCIDKFDKSLIHNFVEFNYCGNKEYHELVDIIISCDFVKRFNKSIYGYNQYITKCIHYIDYEIKRLSHGIR